MSDRTLGRRLLYREAERTASAIKERTLLRGVEMCRENCVEDLGIIAVLRTYVRCATITSKLTKVSMLGGNQDEET